MQHNWLFNTTVPKSMDNQPLRYLLHQHWLLPKHLIFSLRSDNRILVNQHYLPVNFPVHYQDQVTLSFIPTDFQHPFPNVLADSATALAVLYEDANLIIVNKRRGDKTHPNQPGEVGATINHLAAYLATEEALPYMVHRLDQETSGAILFAKNPAVVPSLVAEIAAKQVSRTYLAWVSGSDLPDQGTIDLSIGRDPQDKRKRRINGRHALKAITHYHVLRRTVGNSLLAIQLETGRTHQIRIHLAAINHPVVGDPLYNPVHDAPFLLLHSWQLSVPMPFHETTINVTAPLPPHFKTFEAGLNSTRQSS